MEPSVIVWDFNGTLLDDVDAGIRSVNTMLEKRGLPVIASREDYYRVFGFPIRDYYARLGFDFEKEPYEILAIEWVDLYMENVKTSLLRDGVAEVLDHFADKGIKQIVLSMTEIGMLRKQIDDLGIGGYFSELCGLDNIHAVSKLELAAEWKKRNPDARPLLIGDTTHDAETARIIGAGCVLVAGGHQSFQKIAECHEAAVYGSFPELYARIRG